MRNVLNQIGTDLQHASGVAIVSNMKLLLPFYKRFLVGMALLPLASSVQADETIVKFDGSTYVSPGIPAEMARSPKLARSATQTLFEFGEASPAGDYSGPPYLLGYEVRASSPANLTVATDKCLVENDVANGPQQANDVISIVANSTWPESETFSVAVALVFPTQKFRLSSLAYSGLNFTGNAAYNEKLRHRWIVQTGGRYYVNKGFLGRTGRQGEDAPIEVIRTERSKRDFDQWVEYDPAATIFADFDTPSIALGSALDEVTGVGLYMDSVDFPGRGEATRQWQFRLFTFAADGQPSH